MILYAGLDSTVIRLAHLEDVSTLHEVKPSDNGFKTEGVKDADMVLLGPSVTDPVRKIQHIYAADKHISIVLLSPVTQVKQIKDALRFAPFIGRNTTVVTLAPETDLKTVCRNAMLRTKQKRGFHRLKIDPASMQGPVERVKLAQMGTFLEYAPIGALLLSESDQIVNFNQKAKKLFPALQKLDVELTTLLPNAIAKQVKEFIHSEHHPEAKLEIAAGQNWLELSTVQVHNEEGVPHYLILLNDVTHEKLESKRIESILESLPQMAFTTDTEGKATYFTKGWYFYTGQTAGEPLGEGWASVVLPEDLSKVTEHWKRSLESGKPYQHVARYRNTKGEYRWHLARVAPVRDNANQIILWVGTCTDIHDQILLTEELERRVKERTYALEMSNSELEQFAHVSSHDLQEPLRKIRTFADLLKESAYDEINESARRYIDKITSTAERMSNSLRSLLQYTRLDSEKSAVPVDVNEVVKHVTQDLELLITQKKATVETENLPVIQAVPIQIQQLFYNLVNNALKFSKADEPPLIRITARDTEPETILSFPELNTFKNYVTITVSDNGIGFEQQHAEKIFSIFQRLHPKTAYEGSGIGLSIVKKVVKNHGGVITVSSQPGKGTTFEMILPM